MRASAVLVLLALVVSAAGCETLRRTTEDAEEPTRTPAEAAADLLAEIHEVRERRPGEGFAVVAEDPGEAPAEGLPDEVRREWEAVRLGLFGGADIELTGALPTARVARFDAGEGRVIFRGNPQTDRETTFALAMAMNEAIEWYAFEAMEPPTSVDQWVARQIAGQAGPAFVSTAIVGSREGLNVPASELAVRPEMAVAIETVAPLLGESMGPLMEPEEPGEYSFSESLGRLILREGLAMGAALYRSGGWSAVEWGRIEPPETSNAAVRTDRWLRGEGRGEWDWPEAFENYRDERGWTQEIEGTVGPALTAVWLEAVVDPRAARTVYSGWLADSFRQYHREDGDLRGMYWVSAWQSPHEAQEIALAAEQALIHFYGEDARERRFRVATAGVNVAVVTYDGGYDPGVMETEVALLTEAAFRLIPEDVAPVSFVPTLYEQYVTVAGEAMLDEESWEDPAAGWTVSVEGLSDWGLQKSDEAHVRWFATHEDGALVQWTTELLNPLQAEFGSQEYIEGLRQAFAATVRSEEPPHVEVKAEPVDPTVELEVVGLIDGRPLALRLWQWHRGDVLVSFSLQGSEETFGARLVEAEAVLGSLEEFGEPVSFERRSAAAQDEGILEFTVEDE